MNFFQAQDNARRNTGRLAVLFGAAVLSLIVLTNLLVAAVYLWTSNYTSASTYPPTGTQQMSDQLTQLPAETWMLISVGVIGVIGVASLYKYLMVRGGGRTIAESLGGSLVTHAGADPATRRLLNVVEEMAIASGISVPPVYLIPEPSINAFAAGFGPDDAVIGINRGTVDHLSRDELQGVIAHEFSHILNGDVSINLRLIAILHGILFLGMIGYGVLRGIGYGAGRRRGNGNGAAPILALGIGLLVIGYAGTFFGNLIKAAVSRQREYLADAAAVQFTRNPDGIAGALKKIGGLHEGSEITRSAASEASHMFFGQVRTLFLNGLMATHPPLDKRIRAIEPRWDGRFSVVHGGPDVEVATGTAPDRPAQVGFAGDSIRVQVNPEQLTEEVGRLDNRSLAAARNLIAGAGAVLRDAAHDPWGARALVYAILLDEDPALRARQLKHLQGEAEQGVPEYTERLIGQLSRLEAPRQLALVEMAMPALKALSRPQYDRFIGNVIELIKMDRVISLPEWVLHRLLVKDLTPHFEGARPIRPRYRHLQEVAGHAAVLLSCLARQGHDDEAGQRAAFDAGARELDLPLTFDADADPNFSRLNEALRHLRLLRPLAKPKLIKASAATATADNRISGGEGALLQGIAAALDCPLPPSIYAPEAPEAPNAPDAPRVVESGDN